MPVSTKNRLTIKQPNPRPSRPLTPLLVIDGKLCATAWTDGSNGSSTSENGAASYSIVDNASLQVIEERAVRYDHAEERFTSNDMEMAAILLCLQAAVRIGIDHLDVRSDSMWSVSIINGDFQLKADKFIEVVDKIRDLGSQLESVSIRHVRREQNARADWLCRKATNQKRRTHIPSHSWKR